MQQLKLLTNNCADQQDDGRRSKQREEEMARDPMKDNRSSPLRNS